MVTVMEAHTTSQTIANGTIATGNAQTIRVHLLWCDACATHVETLLTRPQDGKAVCPSCWRKGWSPGG